MILMNFLFFFQILVMVRTKGDTTDYEKGSFHANSSPSIDSKVSPMNTMDEKPKPQPGNAPKIYLRAGNTTYATRCRGLHTYAVSGGSATKLLYLRVRTIPPATQAN